MSDESYICESCGSFLSLKLRQLNKLVIAECSGCGRVRLFFEEVSCVEKQ